MTRFARHEKAPRLKNEMNRPRHEEAYDYLCGYYRPLPDIVFNNELSSIVDFLAAGEIDASAAAGTPTADELTKFMQDYAVIARKLTQKNPSAMFNAIGRVVRNHVNSPTFENKEKRICRLPSIVATQRLSGSTFLACSNDSGQVNSGGPVNKTETFGLVVNIPPMPKKEKETGTKLTNKVVAY